MPIDVASSGAQKMVWRFEQNDLAAPPVPRHLRDQLREFDAWVFATFEPEMPPYEIDGYIDEALENWPKDYLLVAHDGHGMNSWALHYYLVCGPLAVFLQLPWGGAFMDQQDNNEAIDKAFGQIAELLELPLLGDLRVAIIDGFDAKAWSPISADGQVFNWQQSDEPLADALRAIRAGKLATLLSEVEQA